MDVFDIKIDRLVMYTFKNELDGFISPWEVGKDEQHEQNCKEDTSCAFVIFHYVISSTDTLGSVLFAASVSANALEEIIRGATNNNHKGKLIKELHLVCGLFSLSEPNITVLLYSIIMMQVVVVAWTLMILKNKRWFLFHILQQPSITILIHMILNLCRGFIN